MPAQHTEWTAEMARALPDDGKRYEVLDGELFVSPAPNVSHQRVLSELFLLLAPYVKENRLGEVLWSPADIEFSPRDLVQPDLFVIPDAGGRRPASWREVRDLLLVVEAISPSSARTDRTRKRAKYQQQGIPEYWILDPDAQVVERWRRGDERPAILAESLTWAPREGIVPLEISLPEFFATAVD